MSLLQSPHSQKSLIILLLSWKKSLHTLWILLPVARHRRARSHPPSRPRLPPVSLGVLFDNQTHFLFLFLITVASRLLCCTKGYVHRHHPSVVFLQEAFVGRPFLGVPMSNNNPYLMTSRALPIWSLLLVALDALKMKKRQELHLKNFNSSLWRFPCPLWPWFSEGIRSGWSPSCCSQELCFWIRSLPGQTLSSVSFYF